MTTQLSTIQFHNQPLLTLEQNNVQYVAMRPICENIGLDWAAQYSRIKRDDVLSSIIVIITTVAEDDKKREMICLPIDYLNGWLFGIDVKRVKPEIRDTLIMYKKECYKALADYWFKGKAERQPVLTERTFTHDLKNADAVDIAWLWFEAKMMADFIKTITPALEALNSGYAPQAYSMGIEYGNHIHHLGKLIYRLTAEADFGHNPKPINILKQAIPIRKQYGQSKF